MKKYRYLIVTSIICIFVLLTIFYWNNVYTYIKNPEDFVLYLKSLDIFKGTLLFLVINYLQVILAFIPGGPFEIVAGLMYGPILGIIICDLVMSLASINIYLLVKKYGRKIIELFIDINEVNKLNFLNKNKNLGLILFLIFLIPGTPKDVISYGVGLTDLSLKKWLLINLFGRLPAIILTILATSSLIDKRYEIAFIICFIVLISYLIGIKIYRKININS